MSDLSDNDLSSPEQLKRTSCRSNGMTISLSNNHSIQHSIKNLSFDESKDHSPHSIAQPSHKLAQPSSFRHDRDRSASLSADLSNNPSIHQLSKPSSRHDRTNLSISLPVNQSISQSSKPSASRYDFIKVRVYNGTVHYSVLSRYLLARRLSVSGLSSSLCVKVALAVKKHCVDRRTLDITQHQLEKIIQQCMTDCLIDQSEIDRWIRVSSFIDRRTPLILLVTGAPSCGKSNTARKLANKLNISTVIATHTLNELAYDNENSSQSLNYLIDQSINPFSRTPLHLNKHDSPDQFLERHHARCQVVRESLSYEIDKCIKQGRSCIIEGTEIDFNLYADIGQSTAQSNNQPIVLLFLLHIEPADHTLQLCQSIAQHQRTINLSCQSSTQLSSPLSSQSTNRNHQIDLSNVRHNISVLQKWMKQSISAHPNATVVNVPSRSSVSVARQMHNVVLAAMSERSRRILEENGGRQE